MHPNYTGRDMAIMEQEYERDFERKFNDPIAAFIDHHAVRLGILNPDEAGTHDNNEYILPNKSLARILLSRPGLNVYETFYLL